MTDPTTLASASNLGALNDLLAPLSFRAGWNKHEPSLWAEPHRNFAPATPSLKPAQWRWDRAKAGLDAAGRLINAEQAERRNLFMVNPTEGNHYATLRTLVTAYQMILPGERARSHRHSPHALRLVLDVAEDCYTVVDGVRIDMRPGDVLLTPGWAWHGHGNEGRRPGYWIDFLDVPLVQLLEPMFFENWPDGFQDPETTTRDSPFVFPWDATEAGLAKAEPDGHGRTRHQLGNPALPSIALFMERLTPGREVLSLRTTENQIVAVVSGSGRTTVEGETFAWSRGDVIAIPSWHAFRHAADADAVLFTVTDLPVLQKLGYQREAVQ